MSFALIVYKSFRLRKGARQSFRHSLGSALAATKFLGNLGKCDASIRACQCRKTHKGYGFAERHAQCDTTTFVALLEFSYS